MLATEKSSIEHLGVILLADFHQAQFESYQKVEKSMKMINFANSTFAVV